MLTQLTLRHFRCFEALAIGFASPTTFISGPNAQGKTSLLEAVCVLLRLRSPRTLRLGLAIQHGGKGFLLDGHHDGRHLQFYCGRERKKLALDSVEQKTAREYLDVARVVYFGNRDIEFVRGPADIRRKFMDFVLEQIDGAYRRRLRAYETALRSRNHLLKAAHPKWREISAFNEPLIDAGNFITGSRGKLIARLQLRIGEAHGGISGGAERLAVRYVSGSGEDFAAALEASRAEDARLRQTTVGPHRDDLAFFLNEKSCDFSSEGQQRSVALALKLGEAALLAEHAAAPPLLLLDDIFGELDLARRNALLRNLPPAAQKIITTTHLGWVDGAIEGEAFSLDSGKLEKL